MTPSGDSVLARSADRLIAPAASRGCLDLAGLEAGPTDPDSLRDDLATALSDADTLLAERFWAGEAVTELVRARAWVVEQLALCAWRASVTDTGGTALVAVGGFGRGELHPHSDVDLLVLLEDDEPGESLRRQVENFVTLLWDAGFYLGHSVRSVGQTVDEARRDVVTATNLMDARLLGGDPDLFSRLAERTGPERLWPAAEFFKAKFAEQVERHAQYHDTAYNLEPNIKESPGGLRDFQMIDWVARRHFGSQTLHGLVDRGFLTEGEHADLRQGQEFLWRVRFALHLLAGRAEDRLLFEYQPEIARRFGYEDQHESNLAVEQFMQSYYRQVLKLERLNERLLQLFREELLLAGEDEVRVVDDDFQVRNGYLEVRDENLFLRRPVALMDVFLHLARDETIQGVRASTIRLIRHQLFLLDHDFRADAEVRRRFVELLRQRRGIYSQLQRMNRYGVLPALIPPFAQVVGRMQFDLFHVYTVDQHTLFVVRNLRRLAYDKYRDDFPHAASVYGRIERPEVLYLAALFHDIAKGRGGDHSELGAEDATRFCAGVPMAPADRDLVAWLVANHLVMSQTSQRQDISDPRVIEEFARTVGDQRHLDHLYLFTMADIAATSPKLWNNWKAGLLNELYVATSGAFARGLESPSDTERRIRDARQRALDELLTRGHQGDLVEDFWAGLPDHAFLRISPRQLAWASAIALGNDGSVQVATRDDDQRGVTTVFVHAPDYDGLFSTTTAVLDEKRLDVLSARVMTTAEGWCFDLFQVMDGQGDSLNEVDRTTLAERLVPVLAAQQRVRPIRRRLPRRLRPFMAPPEIRFDTTRGDRTAVEIECTDRPAVLSQIAAALSEARVQVHDARIATFGDHVEDVFEITDRAGQPLDAAHRERLVEIVTRHLEET